VTTPHGGRDVSRPDVPAVAPDVLDTAQAGGIMLRGSAIRTTGYVLGVLLALLSAPLLVRHLGVSDFGRWVTITSLVYIVSGLTELGMTAVGLREYSIRDREGRATLIRDLVSLRSLAALAGMVVAIGFSIVAGYGETLVLGTAIMSVSLLANALQSTYATPLNAGLRLGSVTTLDFARQVATVVVIVALVLLGADLLPFFAAPPIAAFVALALTIGLVRGEIPLRPATRLRPAWHLLRQTLPFAAATALGIVYFRIEIILMSLISTEQETGDFGVAFRVIEIAAGVPWLLVNSAFPILARAAKDDQSRLRYALGRLFEGSVIAGVTMALGLGFGAAFAVKVVGGDAPSVQALQVLSGALIGTFLVATWAFALLTLRRYRALLASNVAALGIGIGLTLLLVPSQGALGGAIAVTATEVALALMYGIDLVRFRRDLRPPLAIFGPVALGVAATVVPLAVIGLPSVVEGILAPLIFLGVLAVCRALPAELVEVVRGR
jgi:O-antigen/teichoic acid export membrane protein